MVFIVGLNKSEKQMIVNKLPVLGKKEVCNEEV
jgi:hypothetical protein